MFRFKHFSVLNGGAAFKVGTDAVLLGSCTRIVGEESFILDIGTGTGIIALMIAQRLSAMGNDGFKALGIDSNEDAAKEAAINFGSSPWASKLEARHISLGELASNCGKGTADLIVSNPPYFSNSLENPDPGLRFARHATSDGLSWRSLIDFAQDALSPKGRLAMILPTEEADKALEYSQLTELRACRILRIKTSPSKAAKRTVVEFCRASESDHTTPAEEILTIQENGTYSPDYLELTKEFHIFA